MEHLKACAEIAAQRTINWQKFCIKDDFSFLVDEGVSPVLLQLLSCALCGSKVLAALAASAGPSSASSSSAPGATGSGQATTQSKSSTKKSKKEEKEKEKE
ncbi:hypothetical protein E2I00_019849, partial [Balaenoptera physalus]